MNMTCDCGMGQRCSRCYGDITKGGAEQRGAAQATSSPAAVESWALVLQDNIRAAAKAVLMACGVEDNVEAEAEQLRVAAIRCRDLGDTLRKAVDAMASAAQVSRSAWVPVSERLPPTGCSVLIDGGIGYFDGIDWRTLMGASHRKIEWKVTHWQPVPKLPAPPDAEGGSEP